MAQQHYMNTADYVILYKRNSPLHRAELAGKLFTKEGQFNINYYKKIKEFGLQAPAGYVVEQYIKQHNIAANTDYDLNLGIHQVAIGRLDGYLVEKRIGLAQVEALKQQDQVISSQGVIRRTYWYLPFNLDFYQQNKNDVVRFWHHIQLAREQILSSN
jgi:polar amino acid transport system substrate-binding protein